MPYITAGMLNESNPKKIPPTINCKITVTTIMNNTVMTTVINLASKILALLKGLTSNNFIVPLLNSSLTIAPAIITIVIIINNSYLENTFSKNPLESDVFLISFPCSIIYLLFSAFSLA